MGALALPLLSGDLFVSGESYGHGIKHMFPILLSGAEIDLEIFGQIRIPVLNQRFRYLPLCGCTMTGDRLLDGGGRVGTDEQVVLCGKALHRLDKLVQEWRTFGGGVASLFDDKEAGMKGLEEMRDKRLTFCQKMLCRSALAKGMDPEIQEFGPFEDGVTHFAGARVKRECPEWCLTGAVVCHDDE